MCVPMMKGTGDCTIDKNGRGSRGMYTCTQRSGKSKLRNASATGDRSWYARGQPSDWLVDTGPQSPQTQLRFRHNASYDARTRRSTRPGSQGKHGCAYLNVAREEKDVVLHQQSTYQQRDAGRRQEPYEQLKRPVVQERQRVCLQRRFRGQVRGQNGHLRGPLCKHAQHRRNKTQSRCQPETFKTFPSASDAVWLGGGTCSWAGPTYLPTVRVAGVLREHLLRARRNEIPAEAPQRPGQANYFRQRT